MAPRTPRSSGRRTIPTIRNRTAGTHRRADLASRRAELGLRGRVRTELEVVADAETERRREHLADLDLVHAGSPGAPTFDHSRPVDIAPERRVDGGGRREVPVALISAGRRQHDLAEQTQALDRGVAAQLGHLLGRGAPDVELHVAGPALGAEAFERARGAPGAGGGHEHGTAGDPDQQGDRHQAAHLAAAGGAGDHADRGHGDEDRPTGRAATSVTADPAGECWPPTHPPTGVSRGGSPASTPVR